MLNKEWLKNTLALCAELGYRTTPTFSSGKAMPFVANQDYKSLSDYTNAVTVAIVLDDKVLLDYDGNKGKIMSLDELEEVLDLDLVGMPDIAQINDAGDSIHWLFKLPEGVEGSSLAHSADSSWPHIDIKRGTQLMHLKPHKTLHLLPVSELEECPQAIIEKLTGGNRQVVTGDDSGLWEAVEASEERASFSDVRGVVEGLDVSYAHDHDSWVRVGMGIWYETRGSEEGLELFHEFSKNAVNYDADALDSRWPSFANKQHKKPVTIGTLMHFKKRSDVLIVGAAVTEVVQKIQAATMETLQLDVIPEIKRGDWDTVRVEQLTKAVQSKFKELTGATVKLGDVREMIKPVVALGGLTDDMPRPEWCEPWVYVGTHNEFFHIDAPRHISSETFNMEYTKLIAPTGDSGQKPSASRFVMNHGFVEVADRVEYLPTIANRLVNLKGVNVFNTFDVRSLPRFDTEMTEAGGKAVEVIRQHLKLLCNDSAEDAYILEQWFAHQIQFKGVKILWAPLISSIEGTGKGIMEILLRRLLGDENVGVVSPEQVKSIYKASWAVGSCVNILNELKVGGANRYEVVNSLKPMITDPTIRVEDKHVKAFQARNTANYLAFTNYIDAIPLNESTRRWWPIRINIDDLNDIGKNAGLSKDDYFDRLVDAVNGQWQQIGLWLQEYGISAEFKALKQAPETQFKANMIATEDTKTTGLSEAREIIEQGFKEDLIHRKAVLATNLLDRINCSLGGMESVSMHDLCLILGKMGFTMHSGQVSIFKGKRRMWTKGTYTHEEVRAFFE